MNTNLTIDTENKSPEPRKFDTALISLDKVLYAVEDKITIFCFAGMTLAVLYGIVMRFVLHVPNQYGEEISRYLMILGVFLGLGAVERKNSHMKVDLLINVLPQKVANVVGLISRIITLVAYVWFVQIAFRYVERIYNFGQLSTCLKVPMYIVYSFVLVGFILGAVHCLVNIWNNYFARVKSDYNEDGIDVTVN